MKQVDNILQNLIREEDIIRISEEDLKASTDILNHYLRGNYSEVISSVDAIVPSSVVEKKYYYLNCLRIISAVYEGRVEEWKKHQEFFYHTVTSGLFPGKDASFLSFLSFAFMHQFSQVPDWLVEGKFDGLSPELILPAFIAYIYTQSVQLFTDETSPNFSVIEIMSSVIKFHNNDILSMVLHLYVTILYYNVGKIEDARRHLNQSLDISFENKWYGPLAELRKEIGPLLDEMLSKRSHAVYTKVRSMNKTILENWYHAYAMISHPHIFRDLTIRESHLARLILCGMTNRQIAEHLNLSVETVKQYCSSIFQKTGIKNRKELIDYVKNHPNSRP